MRPQTVDIEQETAKWRVQEHPGHANQKVHGGGKGKTGGGAGGRGSSAGQVAELATDSTSARSKAMSLGIGEGRNRSDVIFRDGNKYHMRGTSEEMSESPNAAQSYRLARSHFDRSIHVQDMEKNHHRYSDGALSAMGLNRDSLRHRESRWRG
jgi:hypothetical protein